MVSLSTKMSAGRYSVRVAPTTHYPHGRWVAGFGTWVGTHRQGSIFGSNIAKIFE